MEPADPGGRVVAVAYAAAGRNDQVPGDLVRGRPRLLLDPGVEAFGVRAASLSARGAAPGRRAQQRMARRATPPDLSLGLRGDGGWARRCRPCRVVGRARRPDR